MELSEAIERCRFDNILMCEGPRNVPQIGSLALIGHHLIFSPIIAHKDGDKNSGTDELWLLHRAVDLAVVQPISPNGTAAISTASGSKAASWADGFNRVNNYIGGYFYSNNQSQNSGAISTGVQSTSAIGALESRPPQAALLRLKFKNFMQCCFEFADISDAQAVARSIELLSNLSTFEHDYPFYYRCPFKVRVDGWTQFDVQQHQFARLQLQAEGKWRISSVNLNFQVCQSYPEKVIVPKGIGDDYLRISATFRDESRFPVLSYYHHKTRSAILRSGQPLVGPTNRRCREDECILNSLLSGVSKGMIFDTRHKFLSQTARTKGGGCESQMCYSQWKYVNGRVPRLKELHDALAKLIEACLENSSDRWLSRLASSCWLQYVVDALTGAATIAQCINCREGMAVLVHGAEGFDSTLLVTSLAQVLLDADARTLRGIQALIENEWVAAGHPFFLRCAHSAFATGATTGPYESPVFLCFLDCLWQITHQYPRCFEFNEQFLIFLFEHAYASEFGTFLGNNEKDKHRFDVKMRTISLWSYVNHPDVMAPFVNALYEPYDQPLWISVAPQSIVLWERMFLRWQENWTKVDAVQAKLYAWRRTEMELQSKAFALRSATSSQQTTPTTSTVAVNTQVHPLGDTVLTQSANKHLITASNKGNVTAECPPFEEVLKLEQLNIISEQERAGRERESKARILSGSDDSKMLVGINNIDGEENDDDNCTSASFELLDGDN